LGTVQTPAKGTFREDFGIASTTTRRKQEFQTGSVQNNKNVTSRTPFENSQSNLFLTEADKGPKVMRLSDIKKESLKSKSPINIREQQQSKVTEKGTSRKI
jgi:hypothetical protein